MYALSSCHFPQRLVKAAVNEKKRKDPVLQAARATQAWLAV